MVPQDPERRLIKIQGTGVIWDLYRTLLLQMWKAESRILMWRFCKKRSNLKKLDFLKSKCKYVTWSAWTPCTMFVESLCFARSNLRRLLGKTGLWGILCSRVSGRKLMFPGLCVARKEDERQAKVIKKKERKTLVITILNSKIFWLKIKLRLQLQICCSYEERKYFQLYLNILKTKTQGKD